MRHGKKFNHLSRKAGHRKAMLANMASSLIENKRINTTVAKAKALKGYVEPLITKSKNDNTHNRRIVFGYLQDKGAVAELFREVVDKVGDRPGGYTRIIRTGNRLGDNAEMCMMELVDFNEIYTNEKPAKKKTTRRSRRGRGGQKKAASESGAASQAQKQESSAKQEGGQKKEEAAKASSKAESADAKKKEAGKTSAKAEEKTADKKQEAPKKEEGTKKAEAKSEGTDARKEETKASSKDTDNSKDEKKG